MRRAIKRFFISISCVFMFAFIVAAFGVSTVSTDVVKANTSVNLKIAARTLTISNNVNITFMVPIEAGEKSDVKVKAREVNAATGAEEALVTLSADAGIYTYEQDSSQYYTFTYKGISASEMPNVVYAQAYLESDPAQVSEEKKFSIIEYAHKQLGLVPGSVKDATLEELIRATIDYGEAAAKYAGNTVFPADYINDYKYVKLTNATFEDRQEYTFATVGEELTIIPLKGYGLSGGVDGFVDNGDGTYTYTVCAEVPDLSDAFGDLEDLEAANLQKIQAQKDAITMISEVAAGDEIVLPVESVEGVTVAWSIEEEDNEKAAINNGILSIALLAEDTMVTLSATIRCGNVVETTKYSIAVKALQTEQTESMNIYAADGVFNDKTITWEAENFTVVGAQADSNREISTTNSDHYRIYENSTLTVFGTNMTKVVMIAIAGYENSLKDSLIEAGYTVGVSGSSVTITLESPVNEIAFKALAQIRISKIEVTYY